MTDPDTTMWLEQFERELETAGRTLCSRAPRGPQQEAHMRQAHYHLHAALDHARRSKPTNGQ